MQNVFYASNQSSWKIAVLLAALTLLGGRLAFQRYLDHKLDVAQAAWETEVEQAKSHADTEQLKLALLKQADHESHNDIKSEDFEIMRREAYSSHIKYQEFQAQAAREKEQAGFEREREQQAAANGSRNQIAALQRALDIPIQHH